MSHDHDRPAVQSATTAAAAPLVPGQAAAKPSASPKILRAVRKQLRTETALRTSGVRTVLGRVGQVLPTLGQVARGHIIVGIKLTGEGDAARLLGCDSGHACAGHECEANTASGVGSAPSRSSGWKKVQADISMDSDTADGSAGQ